MLQRALYGGSMCGMLAIGNVSLTGATFLHSPPRTFDLEQVHAPITADSTSWADLLDPNLAVQTRACTPNKS
eukprot:4039170-Prymnesium_polylepis.1